MNMGSGTPDVKFMEVSKVELNEDETLIETLDVNCEFAYHGKFRAKFEAYMMLGKKGSLALTGEIVFLYLSYFYLISKYHFSSRSNRSSSYSVHPETIQQLVPVVHWRSTAGFRVDVSVSGKTAQGKHHQCNNESDT